jgi:Cohesin domain
MNHILKFFIVCTLLVLPVVSRAATLNLSPATGNLKVGDTVAIRILLNAQGDPVDGVDIYSLEYDPSYIMVEDSNPNQSGIQIEPGSLMPMTVMNTVDTKTGKIQFSQITSGGTTYTNNSDAVLATVRFRALRSGTATLKFTFTQGSTRDTNVASRQTDTLTSVKGSILTIQKSQKSTQPRAKSFLSTPMISLQEQIDVITAQLLTLWEKLFYNGSVHTN